MSRDFDAAIREAQKEPLTFTLGGEEFRVPNPLPEGPFLRWAKTEGATVSDLLCTWLGDQAEAFIAAHERSGGGLGTMQSIADWVIEESTGRPTQWRSGSPASSSANGTRTSAAASRTPAAGRTSPTDSAGR
jgi:hypothetical protein